MPATPELNQYIIWRRTDKAPCTRHGQPGNAHDPSNWLSERDARALAAQLGGQYGVGFVFAEADPYWFLDLDDVLNADRTTWAPIVHEVLALVPGCAVEVSQSGSGLHIIGRGVVPTDRKIKSTSVEVYTSGRYCAFGPYGWQGNCDTEATAGIAQVVRKYLPLSPDATDGVPTWDGKPRADWSGPTDDEALIRLALGSRSGASMFGGGVSFRDLWEANATALGARWPAADGREYDASSADAALAQHLAFWTGCDAGRIDRLMRTSALVRDKWTVHPSYLSRTVSYACGQQRDVLQQQQRTEPTSTLATQRVGGIMPVERLVEHFAGCAYIFSEKRLWTPTGDLLDRDQFRAAYGGYQFAISADMKRTTRNAYEAYIDCQAHRFPKVQSTFFDPTVSPGEIRDKRINTFFPRWGARQKGDVSLWANHLRKLVPDDGDRNILENYLAACVQLAGQKFQWAPVLQGVDGNGKTILYEALEYALGEQYCHQQNPNDLDNNFNAWIKRKFFVCVEEIHTAGRYSLADALKPLITNPRVPVQGKGIDQATGDNCGNFLFFSNHKDAVLKSKKDRRYAVIYTAHQTVEDLRRDGMDGAYFARLFHWLRDGGGKAAIADWLWTYPLTQTAALFDRAPYTSSTAEARIASLGVAEQIIQESVDLERPGFTHDLIDLFVASELLAKNGKRLAPQRVALVLGELGFVRHPGLPDGKISIAGQRTRLYVREGSDAALLTDRDQIIREIYPEIGGGY